MRCLSSIIDGKLSLKQLIHQLINSGTGNATYAQLTVLSIQLINYIVTKNPDTEYYPSLLITLFENNDNYRDTILFLLYDFNTRNGTEKTHTKLSDLNIFNTTHIAQSNYRGYHRSGWRSMSLII